jgi:hypothetical protein
VPTYWIAHPTDSAFISAHSPEGVGELLRIADRWAAGRYAIREHLPGGSLPAGDGHPWGYAIKDTVGNVRIEPIP